MISGGKTGSTAGWEARVGAVVVLYNPADDIVHNVSSYVSQVDILFIVDNSDVPDDTRVSPLRGMENVEYRWNGGNAGLATALNQGAVLAAENHCDYLLMMDQDSVAPSNLVHEFATYLSGGDAEDVAILAPFHAFRNYERPTDALMVRQIETTITSGTLLNLGAYRIAGPFLDEFFIDYIDFEYCLRLRKLGYRIVRLNRAVLDHSLGRTVAKTFLFRRVAVYNHDPVRVYYRFRNRLRVVSLYLVRYPVWSIKELILFGNEIVKILCFEDRKIRKCMMGFRGIIDCVFDRFGEYKGPA